METNLSHFRVWALSRIKRCGVWSVGFIWIDLGWELCHVTGSQELLQYPCITSHSMWFSHILLYPFSGPHEVLHLMPSPNQWSKSPSMSTTGACCSSVLLECYVDERSLATCYSTHGTEWQLPEPSVGKCEPSTVACRMQRVTGVALAGEWCQVGIFLTKDEIKDIKALDR